MMKMSHPIYYRLAGIETYIYLILSWVLGVKELLNINNNNKIERNTWMIETLLDMLSG